MLRVAERRRTASVPTQSPYLSNPTPTRTALAGQQTADLCAGLLMRARFDPTAFGFDEATAERSAYLSNYSLLEFATRALSIGDNDFSGFGDDRSDSGIVARAFASSAFGDALSTLAEASVVTSYATVENTIRSWVRSVTTSTFRDRESVVVNGDLGLAPLPRGGRAKDATGETLSTGKYSLARFARSYSVDERDILDDNVEAIRRLFEAMGRAAAQTDADLIYSFLFNNPEMTDGDPLFGAGRGNLIEGSGAELTANSLQTAMNWMRDQRGPDGRVLGFRPTVLIVDPAEETTARILLQQIELQNGTVPRLIVEPRMGVNGLAGPDTPTPLGQTAGAWMLAGVPETVEIAHLEGRAAPRVREYSLTQGQWGLGIDVVHDAGVAASDYRGVYFANP